MSTEVPVALTPWCIAEPAQEQPSVETPSVESWNVAKSCPEEEQESGIHPLLQPLFGDWQSRSLGHVQSRRPMDLGKGSDVVELDVLPMGSDSDGTTRDGAPQACGRLSLEEPESGEESREIVLEVFGCNGRRARWLWLDKQHSRRRRVFWIDPHGRRTDCWDCRLLTAARKAAAWIEQQNLSSALGIGLVRLSSCAELQPPRLTVGLCVATKNRLWQLRRALPLNLIHGWPHRDWAKIHVVDFGSTDGTLDFLLQRCRPAIDCGLLHVYSTQELPHWHASVAKNTAHLCSKEDILVNLDSDNLTGPDFPVDVAKQFEGGYTVVQYEDGEGTCGRIACCRRDFHHLRGYDEDCYPMGAQDTDLVQRLRRLPNAQYRKVRGSMFSQAIHNSQELKVSCCGPGYGGLRWGRMDTLNRHVFGVRRDAGQILRNLDRKEIGVFVECVGGQSSY